MTKLAFDGTASSLCYLITPFASAAETVRSFSAAFVRARDLYKLENPKADISCFDLNYYFMCGECDLQFEITHNNFRFTHYLQNELTPLGALRASWFHLVKYRPEDPDLTLPQEDALHFQVFLKLGIHPYRDPNATPAQFAHLLGLRLYKLINAVRDNGFFLDLYTTIGWADCVLSGKFIGSTEDNDEFFRQLERIGYTVKGLKRSVYRRRLTLIGLPITLNSTGQINLPSYERLNRVFSPLIVARTQPGKMNTACQVVKDYISDMGTRNPTPLLFSLDGKWDIMWHAGLETLPLGKISNALMNHILKKDTATLAQLDPPIERIETHLLPFPAVAIEIDDIIENYGEEHRSEAEKPPGASLIERIAVTWKRVRQLKIASPLLNEISSHLSLFSTVAKDNDNRVMTDYIIYGALDSLLHITIHLEYVSDTILWYESHPDVPEEEENLYKRYRSADLSYSELQRYLKNWCKFAGKALRQRVTGSFENLLDRAVSAPALRGTLQKMIFVMDGLLREFYGTLPPNLTRIEKDKDHERPPRLASIFTPTTLICSQRYLELVEIPAGYSFSPHQVLPQLWHEVGQCVFFRRFNPFESPLLNRIVKDGSLNHQQAFHRIGDHFADLLVFTFGFQKRFDSFAKYLSSAILRSEYELMVFGKTRERVNTRRRDILLREIQGRLYILASHAGQEEAYAKTDVVEISKKCFEDLFPLGFSKPVVDLPAYCSNSKFLSFLKSPLNLIVNETRFGFGLWEVSTYEKRHIRLLERLSQGEICDLLECDCSLAKTNYRCNCQNQTLVNELYLYFYELHLAKEPLDFQQLSALGFTALQSFRSSSPAFERGVEVRNERTKRPTGG